MIPFRHRHIRFPSIAVLAGVLVVGACGLSTNGGAGEAGQVEAARRLMVEEQLRQRGIRDRRVLGVMATVPRHRFVPAGLRPHAYDDTALPIEAGQTISQPYIVGLMSESLELTGHEKVLEIGTGSGYQAAVLSRLADQVYSIEIIPRLAATARSRLASLGYGNVTVLIGDGNRGWPSESPYDAIIVTAAAPEIPQALVEQLAEGGRLILPLVRADGQHLIRLRKSKGELVQHDLGLVRFVPLIGGDG